MKRQYNVVTSRKVTRWYLNGRGYNSELAANMQLAKAYVSRLRYEAFRDYLADRGNPRYTMEAAVEFEKAWFQHRYPAREGCNCLYCSSHRHGGRWGAGRGCWIAKMADYRQIAREIIRGDRSTEGEILRPIKALPAKAGVA